MRRFVWPLILVLFFITIYVIRVHEEMVDFEVYRTAADRALDAEPLYRPADGHYQYKYFPAFAVVMAPFAVVPDQVARAVWFALTCGLLVLFVRWSIIAIPGRSRRRRRRRDAGRLYALERSATAGRTVDDARGPVSDAARRRTVPGPLHGADRMGR